MLFASASAATVLLTGIVPSTNIYASLSSHQLEFSIAVLNSILILLLYALLQSSVISTKFFALNLDGLFDVLSNKFIIF